MPRTYGEVLPVSFPLLFNFCPPDQGRAVFIDLGSGYGSLVKSAVEQYGCCYAIGIEKYNDKADVSIAMHAALPKELGGKMRFYLEDVNDTEYTEILEGLEFATLVIFCNNLAFNQGTVSRLAVKMRCVMDYFAARAVKVVVISSRELPALEDRLYSSLPLQMTWNDEPHASNVYMSTPSAS